MKLATVAVAVTLAALSGCVDRTAREAVDATAQADLGCADVDILVLSQTSGPEQPSVVEYRATGCHQTARYHCEDDHQSPSVDYTCRLEAHTTATSTVVIDDTPLVPDGSSLCRSGAAEGQGFYGVDLTSPGGDTLRIARNLDLSYGVIALASDGTSSPLMQGCATVAIAADPLAGLAGTATIACASGASSVQGTVTFAGCE